MEFDMEKCYSAFKKYKKPTDEMKICSICSKQYSDDSFIMHIEGNRHKLAAECEAEVSKMIKEKVQNWLVTGRYHTVDIATKLKYKWRATSLI